MSRPAGHCRSHAVTSGCHGLTHSESRGQGLPAASTPLAGGRGVKAARARLGGRDGGRGMWRARYIGTISPRPEAAARDSLIGGGWFGLDSAGLGMAGDAAGPGAVRRGGSLLSLQGTVAAYTGWPLAQYQARFLNNSCRAVGGRRL